MRPTVPYLGGGEYIENKREPNKNSKSLTKKENSKKLERGSQLQ